MPMVRDSKSLFGTWEPPKSTLKVCNTVPMEGELTYEYIASWVSVADLTRFVTVCGDGEYIIYTSLAWRNKAFGSGTSFAWASDSNTYAVLEGKSKLRVYRNFKERPGLIKSSGSWAVEGIHGGPLLGARGNGFVMFWDWETGAVVRRIEVDATNVTWSGNGGLVAITSEDSFYLLRFDRDAYSARLDSGETITDEGVEEAFELVAEISET